MRSESEAPVTFSLLNLKADTGTQFTVSHRVEGRVELGI